MREQINTEEKLSSHQKRAHLENRKDRQFRDVKRNEKIMIGIDYRYLRGEESSVESRWGLIERGFDRSSNGNESECEREKANLARQREGKIGISRSNN